MHHAVVNITLGQRARAIHLSASEIARTAGISRMTVARVLSGSPRVLRETEDRVAAVIGDREAQLRAALGVVQVATGQTAGAAE